MFKLEQSKISGTNKVSLRFRNVPEKSNPIPIIVRVDAIGYSLGGETGELHATLVQSLMNSRQTFRVHFVKGAGPSRNLNGMLKEADPLIRDAKRNHL